MVRPLGATALSDGSIDFNYDGVGDYCPEGADCGYASPDTDVEGVFVDIATGLDALGKLLGLASQIADAKVRADFEKKVRDAQKKLLEGQSKMADASQKIAEASNGLYSANDQINSLAGTLQSLQASMATQLTAISGYASMISGFDASIAQLNTALADANRRLSYSKIRSNYPAGPGGLTQQRADGKKASTDIFNISGQLDSVNTSKSDTISQMNQAGEVYNSLIPQVQAAQTDLVSAYVTATAFQDQRNSAFQEYNQGGLQVRSAVNDYLQAGQSYGEFQRSTLLPMAQAKTGAVGGAEAFRQFSQGNYFSGFAEINNAGWSAGLQGSANASLIPYAGIAMGVFSEAGKAVDAQLKQNGGQLERIDAGRLALDVTINSANRFLGVKEFQNASVAIQNTVELASAGDTTGATLIATTQAIPSLLYGAGTVAQTGSAFAGPLGPVISASIPPVRDGLNALQSGVINGFSATINAKFSEQLTPSGPGQPGQLKPISVSGPGARGIGERETLGKPSTIFVGIGSTLETGTSVAQAVSTSYFSNNRGIASDVANKIYDLSRNAGNWPPPVLPGSFKIGGP